MRSTFDRKLMLEAEGYLELELPEQAQASLEQVATQSRESFEWHYLMAEALRSTEKCDAALRHLATAHALRPSEISVHLALGWCFKRTGQLTIAIEKLLQANEICKRDGADEQHALVMYNLSCYYALAGRKEDMLRWLALALHKGPQYRVLIGAEPDFDSYRDDSDFRLLAEGTSE